MAITIFARKQKTLLFCKVVALSIVTVFGIYKYIFIWFVSNYMGHFCQLTCVCIGYSV